MQLCPQSLLLHKPTSEQPWTQNPGCQQPFSLASPLLTLVPGARDCAGQLPIHQSEGPLLVWFCPLPLLEALDASLEDLLTRVDEFVGMLDMIRGDSSHVVSEGVPRIYAKATEMRRIYSKIDKLEAFVRMIGSSVARMEEQVTRAEAELGAFPRAFQKLLHTISVPSFFTKPAPARPPRAAYEPPVLFRTEDHFPCCPDRPQL
uniref:Biosis of lysosomal organelles complex 1 subunit 4 n=1 Tax=Marmota marmota marmota TaxID=9994 RepID=A0A8C5ZLA5_MARMA